MKNGKGEKYTATYLCTVCKIYVYDEKKGDPDTNLAAGTTFNNIPGTWRCPICGATRNSLKLIASDELNQVLSLKEEFTLVKVRNNALEKLAGLCGVYKVCDGNPDRLCMGQKFGEAIGMGGIGKGLSFTANVNALDRLKLKTRLISEHYVPDMTTTIYGHEISIPVLASSLSGVINSMGGSISENEFAFAILEGSKNAGTLGLIGNTADDGEELTGVEAVKKVGLGIPIFKPQKNERLLQLIKLGEDAGAIAVGVDLDGVGSANWEKKGKPLYRKSVSDLRELVDSTHLPFIAKGIMSVEDAMDAMDAGVRGIDVSNHGGRILDSTRGVAEVLPEISEALKGKITITTGGGVRTGFDVMKMLALGANGVLIGRDMIRAAVGGGPEGIKLHFDYLRSDLKRGMVMTGCKSIDDINYRIFDK